MTQPCQTQFRLLMTLALSTLLAACGTARPPVPVSLASQIKAAARPEPRFVALNECPSCRPSGESVSFWMRPVTSLAPSGQNLISETGALTLGTASQAQGQLMHLEYGAALAATAAQEVFPLACSRIDGRVRPDGLPSPTVDDAGLLHDAWLGGTVQLTRPLPQSDVSPLQRANSVCTSAFGSGWRALDSAQTTDPVPLGTLVADAWANGDLRVFSPEPTVLPPITLTPLE